MDESGETLNGRTHLIILELSKLDRILSKSSAEMSDEEAWAVFLKYSKDPTKRYLINEIFQKEESIAMAGELLKTISADDHLRARLLSEYKDEVDQQSKMVGAKREGIRQGKREGMREARIETAQNLLQIGLPIDQIMQATGLSLEIIKQLQP